MGLKLLNNFHFYRQANRCNPIHPSNPRAPQRAPICWNHGCVDPQERAKARNLKSARQSARVRGRTPQNFTGWISTSRDLIRGWIVVLIPMPRNIITASIFRRDVWEERENEVFAEDIEVFSGFSVRHADLNQCGFPGDAVWKKKEVKYEYTFIQINLK